MLVTHLNVSHTSQYIAMALGRGLWSKVKSSFLTKVLVTSSTVTGVVMNDNTFKLIREEEDLEGIVQGGGKPYIPEKKKRHDIAPKPRMDSVPRRDSGQPQLQTSRHRSRSPARERTSYRQHDRGYGSYKEQSHNQQRYDRERRYDHHKSKDNHNYRHRNCDNGYEPNTSEPPQKMYIDIQKFGGF